MTPIKKLLIVDDDEVYTYITKRIIEQSNLASQIKIFKNGKEAIDFIEETKGEIELLPDVILLDLSMPILDGWGFLEEYILLKPYFGKKITLYIVSSSISPSDYQRAKEYSDVSDFIIKPITTEKFIYLIKNLPV